MSQHQADDEIDPDVAKMVRKQFGRDTRGADKALAELKTARTAQQAKDIRWLEEQYETLTKGEIVAVLSSCKWDIDAAIEPLFTLRSSKQAEQNRRSLERKAAARRATQAAETLAALFATLPQATIQAHLDRAKGDMNRCASSLLELLQQKKSGEEKKKRQEKASAADERNAQDVKMQQQQQQQRAGEGKREREGKRSYAAVAAASALEYEDRLFALKLTFDSIHPDRVDAEVARCQGDFARASKALLLLRRQEREREIRQLKDKKEQQKGEEKTELEKKKKKETTSIVSCESEEKEEEKKKKEEEDKKHEEAIGGESATEPAAGPGTGTAEAREREKAKAKAKAKVEVEAQAQEAQEAKEAQEAEERALEAELLASWEYVAQEALGAVAEQLELKLRQGSAPGLVGEQERREQAARQEEKKQKARLPTEFVFDDDAVLVSSPGSPDAGDQKKRTPEAAADAASSGSRYAMAPKPVARGLLAVFSPDFSLTMPGVRSGTDWVALYRKGAGEEADPSSYITYHYVSSLVSSAADCSEPHLCFPAQSRAGDYFFKYMGCGPLDAAGPERCLSRSGNVHLGQDYTLVARVLPADSAAQRKRTVRVFVRQVAGEPSDCAWLAAYAPGTQDPSQYFAYKWLSSSAEEHETKGRMLEFEVPSTKVGTWLFRVFATREYCAAGCVRVRLEGKDELALRLLPASKPAEVREPKELAREAGEGEPAFLEVEVNLQTVDPSTERPWVGLFSRTEQKQNQWIRYHYISQLGRSRVRFPLGARLAGEVEARLFGKYGYEVIAKSNCVRIPPREKLAE